MRFGKKGDDPTARRRLSAEQAHKLTQQIIRRHLRKESVREISRAVNLPRTSVHRIIQRHEAAEAAERRDDDELMDEQLADDLAELDELDGIPFDLLSPEQQMQRELSEILAELRDDPGNALAQYRLRHIPKDTPGYPA